MTLRLIREPSLNATTLGVLFVLLGASAGTFASNRAAPVHSNQIAGAALSRHEATRRSLQTHVLRRQQVASMAVGVPPAASWNGRLDQLNSLRKRPPFGDCEPVEAVVVQAVGARVLAQGDATVTVLDDHVVTFRLGLLQSGGPTAVSRFVAAVGVQPIDRVLRARTRAHVGQERSEVIRPFLADRNSAPAVVRISGIATAPKHPAPDSVLRRVDASDRRAVGATSCADQFSRQATAAARPASDELDGWNGRALAAVALTCPRCQPTAGVRASLDHQKPAESLSAPVDELHRLATVPLRAA